MGEEQATLRSKFVVHWTGHDIEDYYGHSAAKNGAYVYRLYGMLHEGLWMRRNEDAICIPGQNVLRYYDTPMTCFTEIKLSDIERHTERYGRLGFGFNRSFIMGLSGAPVHYVDGRYDINAWNSVYILRRLNDLRNSGQLSSDVHDELRDILKNYILFMKDMSEPPGTDNFQNLDESEWRIIFVPENNRFEFVGDDRVPAARIPFTPVDLKILIFPNGEILRRALEIQCIASWFGNLPNYPIMLTVADCLHF